MATKKTAAKKTAAKKAAPKAARLSVRMYRQGLGDCFLITLPKENGEPFFLMIDCGVILGTSDSTEKMTRVVEDIIAATKGRIDVLAATHEHWDHVSGFVQARELFSKKLKVNEVWVAWTEDPKDRLAANLRGERRTAENALRMAVHRLGLRGAAETAERVDSLVGFFGARAGTTEDAMKFVQGLGPGKPRYCSPEDPPLTLEGLPAYRFWVMGPPKDERLIKKSNPGKGEAYGLDAGPGGSQGFLVSALTRNMGAAGTSSFSDEIEEPFDWMYAIPMARAEHMPFFRARYFGEATDGAVWDRSSGAEVRDQSWRRIDATWSEAAETMALQLDAATNNTSLVIAIEIVATGEILLFPGDAQAGNWLSWQSLAWEVEDPKTGKPVKVTGPDLLARTVLYKVGHHGSHNATLQAKGLEQMVNDGLMAMIPVDHAMAVKKRWNKIPQPELVDRLQEKTQGRVLRIDDEATKRAELGDAWKALGDRVAVTDLYFEISF